MTPEARFLISPPPLPSLYSGHFALLALDVANRANGIRRNPFKEGGRGKHAVGKSLGHQLGFVDQSRGGSRGVSWGREY
jgi:hypothetical protein